MIIWYMKQIVIENRKYRLIQNILLSMSHYISTEREVKHDISDGQPLVNLSKAKVILGCKAKKHLNDLGKSMEGMMVSDIFKELSQREQKIIDNNMDNEADKAF